MSTKSSVRDLWIYNTWKSTGCGLHKDKKKVIPRKQKYKNLEK